MSEKSWASLAPLLDHRRYVRNLTLLDGRLTPELYNLTLAAKQIVGDDYAPALIDVARDCPPQRLSSSASDVAMGCGQIADADGEVKPCKNRPEGVRSYAARYIRNFR